jgi:chromosome segregation ATPase
MTEPLRIDDALTDLDTKVAALERGLVQYQKGVTSWTNEALARVTKNVGAAERMGKELAHREALIHKDRGEIERQHAEAVDLKNACENRQRELNELSELLAQAQRDVAAREQKLSAEFEQKKRTLEAADAASTEKKSQADSLHESLEKRARDIEIETQRLQQNRAQWQRDCAEQQEKLDVRATQLDEKSGNFEKDNERLCSLARQCEEQKTQSEDRERELAAREADLIDRERTLSDTQAAHGVRECRLEESQQQIEAERVECRKLKEQLKKQQSQLERQVQEQKAREGELAAQSEQIAKQSAQIEKERIATAELEARCQANEKSLEAGRSLLEAEKFELENRLEHVHTLETSLQTDRAELAAARETFDAQMGAARIQLDHEQDQLRAKLEQAGQQERELRTERTTMERLKEEFERRIAQAGNREADFVAQQAKLEAAAGQHSERSSHGTEGPVHGGRSGSSAGDDWSRVARSRRPSYGNRGATSFPGRSPTDSS